MADSNVYDHGRALPKALSGTYVAIAATYDFSVPPASVTMATYSLACSAVAGGDPVNGSDPSGDCVQVGPWCIGSGPQTSTININYQHVQDIEHAWDCLMSACYTTKTGAANAWAGIQNTVNYWSGLPGVPPPYPCSNAGAYVLGGQVPYLPLALLPGAGEAGVGEIEAIEGEYAAEGGGTVLSGLSPAEQASLNRLEQLPEFAGRTFSESPSAGQDWVDNLGNTYDQIGDPAASSYWGSQEQNFLNQIPVHLAKADYLVLDMSGFTQAQITTVSEYIDGLPAAEQARIIRLGF